MLHRQHWTNWAEVELDQLQKTIIGRDFCVFLPILQNINEFGKQFPCWKNNYYNAAHKHSYLFSQMQSCKIFALIKTDYLEKAYLHSRNAGKQTKATKINLGDRRKGFYLHSNFGIMESSSNIFFQKAIKLIFLHQMCMNLSRILSVFQIWGLLRIQFVLKRKRGTKASDCQKTSPWDEWVLSWQSIW